MACKVLPQLPAESLQVTAPSGVTPALASLAGIWEGYWGDLNGSNLIVKSIAADKVTTVYVFASRPQDITLTSNADGSLTSGGFKFMLSADGKTLDGTLTIGQVVNKVSMTKCIAPVSPVARTTANPPAGAPALCKAIPDTLVRSALQVTAPPAGLSPALAGLSGVWEGSWNGSAPSNLIVQKVSATQVDTIYIFQGSASVQALQVQPDGTLRLGNFQWTPTPDGQTLNGLLSGPQRSTVAMTKCTAP